MAASVLESTWKHYKVQQKKRIIASCVSLILEQAKPFPGVTPCPISYWPGLCHRLCINQSLTGRTEYRDQLSPIRRWNHLPRHMAVQRMVDIRTKSGLCQHRRNKECNQQCLVQWWWFWTETGEWTMPDFLFLPRSPPWWQIELWFRKVVNRRIERYIRGDKGLITSHNK